MNRITFMLILIILMLQPTESKQSIDENKEICSIKCFDRKNNQNEIACDLSYKNKNRVKRTDRIVLEYPFSRVDDEENDHLPRRVEYLKCLKSFKHCRRPSTTTTKPPFHIDDFKNYYEDLKIIYNEIKNYSAIILPNKFDQILSNLTDMYDDILSDDYEIDHDDRINITKSSLAIIDNLIGRDNLWSKMGEDLKSNATNKMITFIEQIPLVFNDKEFDEDNNYPILKITCQNISLYSRKSSFNESLIFEMNQTKLRLPSLNFLNNTNKGQNEISSTALILKNTNFSPKICDEESINYKFLNTPIISIKIGDHNKSIHFPDQNYFYFKTKNYDRLKFGDKIGCYYWNTTDKCWSSNGCYYRKIESNPSTSICECNHLTSIVIIVDIYNRDSDDPIKTWLTYITSTTSIICTIFALFISYRYNYQSLTVVNDQFRTKSNLILLNLHMSIWLILSHLIIIIGLERAKDEPNIICQSISVFLLYSLLTMITFTFLKCFHCSWFIVFAPLGVSIQSLYYLLIGYFSPLIIIGIGLIWIYFNETKQIWQDVFESLCGRYFCWISSYKYKQHIWLFLGPLYCLLITNAILFILIMYRYCTSPIHLRTSKTKHIFSMLLNAFLFFCNFGLTWLLAIYYINEQIPTSRLFSMLFILLNGSQGIFLLIEQIFRFFKRKNPIIQSKSSTLTTKLRTTSTNDINNNNNNNDNDIIKSTNNLKQKQEQHGEKNYNMIHAFLPSLFRRKLFNKSQKKWQQQQRIHQLNESNLYPKILVYNSKNENNCNEL